MRVAGLYSTWFKYDGWMDEESYCLIPLTTQQCHSKKEGPNGGMLLFLAAGLHFKKFDFLP